MNEQLPTFDEFKSVLIAANYSSNFINYVWSKIKSEAKVPLIVEYLQKEVNQEFYQWAGRIAKSVNANKPDLDREIAHLFIETCWTCIDAQMCIGELVLSRTRGIPPGGTHSFSKTPDQKFDPNACSSPMRDMNLIFFWFYATMSLECIYRSWSRMGLFIEMIAGLDSLRTNPKYVPYPWKVWKLFKNHIIPQYPSIQNEPSFISVDKVFSYFGTLGDKRNEYSHTRSGLLAHQNMEYSGWSGVTIRGKPLLDFKESAPEYEKVFEEVVEYYRKCYECILEVRKLSEWLVAAKATCHP